MTLMKRYPLITFFVLAYALSWWPWLLYTAHLFPFPLFPTGPALAALLMTEIIGGRAGTKTLLLRLVQWRARPRWYAVVLLLPVVIWGTAVILNALLGAQRDVWESVHGACVPCLVRCTRGLRLPIVLRPVPATRLRVDRRRGQCRGAPRSDCDRACASFERLQAGDDACRRTSDGRLKRHFVPFGKRQPIALGRENETIPKRGQSGCLLEQVSSFCSSEDHPL